MKKSIALTLVLLLMITLTAACRATSADPDNSGGTTPSSETKVSPSPSADNGSSGDSDHNVTEDVLAQKTSQTIEEIIGVTETGVRRVMKKTDEFLQYTTGSWDYPPSAEYQVVTIGEDGYVADCIIYYVYADETAFWATFENSMASVGYYNRGWNPDALYFGHYVFPSFIDLNNDGKIDWDEVWDDWNTLAYDDYILIEG